jgi:hypothetical protein
MSAPWSLPCVGSFGGTMNVVLSAAEQQQLLQQSTPKEAAVTINFYEKCSQLRIVVG